MNSAVACVDDAHVALRFKKRRYTVAVKLNGSFARVITRQRQRYVAAKTIQQKPQVAGAASDIFASVEDILYSEPCRRCRHQLHEAARSLRRNCLSIES